MEQKLSHLVTAARTIVIVQADNPDADSLGSALALEHILGDLGKEVSLYCGVDMPTYLRYMSGWDRVQKELPKNFDLSIIVDASTYTLFEQLTKSGQLAWLKARPAVVLDHHKTVEKPLDFATVSLVDPNVASTGELIFGLAKSLDWTVNIEAATHIMSSILGDTQGLTNDLAKPATYRVMAELIELGVSRPRLEEIRRLASKMTPSIYAYKGQLITRTELASDTTIAHVTVPQAEINEFSPFYNPAALVQFDMLQIQGVQLSIVFKTYDDGHVTGAIRSNVPIAAQLAEHMGGGGHDYASGFKIQTGKSIADIKADCLTYAAQLLHTVKETA